MVAGGHRKYCRVKKAGGSARPKYWNCERAFMVHLHVGTESTELEGRRNRDRVGAGTTVTAVHCNFGFDASIDDLKEAYLRVKR